MSIYIDPIGESLGLKPIREYFPDYDFDPPVPEDASSNTPKGMPMDYYFPSTFEGLTHTDEYKEQLSKMMTERRKENPQMGNFKPHTEETKKLLSEKSMGNTNGRTSGYTLSDEFKENARQRWLGDDNPMSNPESVEKVRKSAFNKKPCPTCGQKMNAGNLSRHIKKCA